MEIISCCLLVFVYFCVVWHKLLWLWQKLLRLWQKLPDIYYISRMPGNISVQNNNIGVWPGNFGSLLKKSGHRQRKKLIERTLISFVLKNGKCKQLLFGIRIEIQEIYCSVNANSSWAESSHLEWHTAESSTIKTHFETYRTTSVRAPSSISTPSRIVRTPSTRIV